MAWLLLLIQLLPSIINLITLILELIKKKKGPERVAARRELFALAKKHVKKKRGENKHTLTYGQTVCEEEFCALAEKLK